MRLIGRLTVGSLAIVAFTKAQAIIVFSDVVIAGSLSGGASVSVGPYDIDFYFPRALVGDPVDPLRAGDISITYNARGTTNNDFMDRMTLSVLGALSGSGKIFVNEVIEDNATGDILATHGALLDDPSDMPYTAYVNFSRASRDIRVKKSFLLTAIDTRDFDVASISLVEQRLRTVVPEPASFAALGLGLLALRRRRRK